MTVTQRLRFEILKRDGFACIYCGKKASSTVSLEIDHIQARSKGGADHPDNYAASCQECNRGKSNRSLAGEMCAICLLHPVERQVNVGELNEPWWLPVCASCSRAVVLCFGLQRARQEALQ